MPGREGHGSAVAGGAREMIAQVIGRPEVCWLLVGRLALGSRPEVRWLLVSRLALGKSLIKYIVCECLRVPDDWEDLTCG